MSDHDDQMPEVTWKPVKKEDEHADRRIPARAPKGVLDDEAQSDLASPDGDVVLGETKRRLPGAYKYALALVLLLATLAVVLLATTDLSGSGSTTSSSTVRTLPPGPRLDSRSGAILAGRLVEDAGLALGPGWSGPTLAAVPGLDAPCGPGGTYQGVVSTQQGTWTAPADASGQEVQAVVDLLVYDTPQHAVEDQQRAGSEQHRQCLLTQAARDLDTLQVTVEPTDLGALGAAGATLTVAGDPPRYRQVASVQVGNARAELRVTRCCEPIGLDNLRTATAGLVQLLVKDQELPPPPAEADRLAGGPSLLAG